MKRNTMVMAGGAALALTGLLVWVFMPRPIEVELAVVSQGHFEQFIDEDARTRLRDKYLVSAPLSGRLQRMALREGDKVLAGAAVAVMAPALSPLLDERALAEQQARVETTEASLQRASTRIEAARVAQEQARNEVRRTEQLAQKGFVASAKVDADRLALKAAGKELETAIDSQHVARHELQQARAALSAVRAPQASARGGFVVRAPVAGQVLRVLQASEGTVAQGTPLIELGDIARMEIVAELLTTDALSARPDSVVRIEGWGGPTVLQGRVRRVEPAAFTKVSALGVEEQRVKVLIDITSPLAEWAALGDGFRVAVRILTRSEEGVLRVPVSALFPLPDTPGSEPGRTAVFVHEGGRAHLRTVVLGGRNGSEAWVKQGLRAGEQVIVYPSAAVSDGARVRARKV